MLQGGVDIVEQEGRRNDWKDMCCIIHRWRQRRNGREGKVRREERWGRNINREKEFRGKRF